MNIFESSKMTQKISVNICWKFTQIFWTVSEEKMNSSDWTTTLWEKSFLPRTLLYIVLPSETSPKDYVLKYNYKYKKGQNIIRKINDKFLLEFGRNTWFGRSNYSGIFLFHRSGSYFMSIFKRKISVNNSNLNLLYELVKL